MKVRHHPNMHSTLVACCLAAAFATAHASETATTTTTTVSSSTPTTTPAVGTSSVTEGKLSAEFADFLGGEKQAAAVVSGLRQGSVFSLESGSGSGTTTTTIDPPTGTMGYGNVRIALRLAQAELGQLGITQPTGDELSAVLLGGEINGTQVDGILSLRADGMGWGQIAQQYGMTVGQLMGKGAGLTRQSATTTTSSETRATGKAGHVSGASQARSNGYIPSGGGDAHGSGMVTASGDSVGGSGYGGSKGQAHRTTPRSQDAGLVSAGGQHVSLSGASNAGGGSKALAPGQAKKN